MRLCPVYPGIAPIYVYIVLGLIKAQSPQRYHSLKLDRIINIRISGSVYIRHIRVVAYYMLLPVKPVYIEMCLMEAQSGYPAVSISGILNLGK